MMLSNGKKKFLWSFLFMIGCFCHASINGQEAIAFASKPPAKGCGPNGSVFAYEVIIDPSGSTSEYTILPNVQRIMKEKHPDAGVSAIVFQGNPRFALLGYETVVKPQHGLNKTECRYQHYILRGAKTAKLAIEAVIAEYVSEKDRYKQNPIITFEPHSIVMEYWFSENKLVFAPPKK